MRRKNIISRAITILLVILLALLLAACGISQKDEVSGGGSQTGSYGGSGSEGEAAGGIGKASGPGGSGVSVIPDSTDGAGLYYTDVPKSAETNFTIIYNEYTGSRESGKGELPEGYRADLVPVLEDSTLKKSNVLDTYESGKHYSLVFETMSGYKDVVAFYKEIMQNAESRVVSDYETCCDITGTLDGVTVHIGINLMPEGTLYLIEMVI
ncbi:MAG TPA: hypothetical protein PK767_00875 [Clostridiales bacterium]|nr:hypothetical protein [Clostridiales bacterium]HPP34780.1 hypothetical protein [Clostridiales bacterium]